jgi:hypothetical protein
MAKSAWKKPAAKPVTTAAPKKKLPDVDLGSFRKPTPPAPKAKAPKPAEPAAPLAPAKAPLDPGASAKAPIKPAEPKGGRYVIIAGEGTMPLGADNWRRVARGVSISVSADELAWLEANGVAFKRA